MSNHAHLKNERIVIRPLASVIPIRLTREQSNKKHGKEITGKAKKDLPFFYPKPIFKAKKHDPL